MKRILLLLVLLNAGIVYCQDYTSAGGLRLGSTFGFTYKMMLDDTKAVEGMLSFRDRGQQLTALYENYMPIFLTRSDHWFFYYGFGAHAGYTKWNKEHSYVINGDEHSFSSLVIAPLIGVDGVAGLEYRLHRAPIAFGCEIKPYAEVFTKNFFNADMSDFAITIKYTFN